VKYLVLSLSALACNLTCFSQGGSAYSTIGLGEERRSVGAVYESLGGTAIAMPNTHAINTLNPAMLGMSPDTRLQLGYRFNQHVNSNGSASLAQNNGEIDGLLALFSVDTAMGIGVSVGLLPLTSVNLRTSVPLRREIDGRAVEGRSERSGDGGVSSVILGASFRPVPSVYVGASIQPLFGSITYTDRVTIDGEGSFSMTEISNYDTRGFLARLGLFWQPTPELGVGFAASLGSEGSVVNANRSAAFRPGAVSFDTVTTSTYTTAFPTSVGVGLSYRLGRSLVGLDAVASNHTGVTGQRNPDVVPTTSGRLSLALSRPGSNSLAATFTERVGLHAGATYQQGWFTINNNRLTELSVSGGLDFPMGESAVIDAAITLGTRSGIPGFSTDTFGRFVVTISIGEMWFRPFARE
jgi:hypothetical protein